MSEKLINSKQVKIMPLYNPNFEISNKDELQDLIGGTPIVKDNGIQFGIQSDKIIGWIYTDSKTKIENDYIFADVYILKEYKDYVFSNYSCSVDGNKILRFSAIYFSKPEGEE